MSPLFLYLIKVNIALLLFYLIYRFGLRKLTFYTLNRFYLLFGIGFSSLFPFIPVQWFLPQRHESAGLVLSYLPDLSGLTDKNALEFWNVLTIIFWSGVAVMGIRFLLQCISLARIHFNSAKSDRPGLNLRYVKEKINPFSFFKAIYLNPVLHTPDERQSILTHERVHAKEWHTADILAGELNRIFYWFNPGAWWMMTAIRENLEFITDRHVLRSGADAKSYQYCLVRASHIPYTSSLATNFNFSHLKIRITMMDKKPSNEMHLIKYLVLIPLVSALTLVFNVSKASFTPPVSDTVPASGDHVSEPIVMEIVTHPAVVADSSKEAEPTVIHRVRNSADSSKKEPLYVVNGVIFTDGIESINPNDLAHVSVYKGSKATEMFGKKAEGGVIMIVTKDHTSEEQSGERTITMGMTINGSGEAVDSVGSAMTVKRTPDLINEVSWQDALLIVDGEIKENQTAEDLDAADITSISVLKGEMAVDKYGEKGRRGVIIVTTK